MTNKISVLNVQRCNINISYPNKLKNTVYFKYGLRLLYPNRDCY